MRFKRLISKRNEYQDGDLLLAEDHEGLPQGTNVYPIKQPGDLSNLIFSLFGNNLHGCHLADTLIELGGLNDLQQVEVLDAISSVVQQWGTSIIDPAHGLINLIANAKRLINAPRIPQHVLGYIPVLAIAAGPSTTALMELIRERSKYCFVVCADAALKPLLAAGVTVHACTPLERLTTTAEKVEGQSDKSVIFCGSPFVPNAAIEAFSRHSLWLSPEPLFDWYLGEDIQSDYHPGTTSGTSCIAVAKWLTKGPIYLIGHDLCGGHMSGADVSQRTADAFDCERMGNDGLMHQSKTAWIRAKSDIEGSGDKSQLINVGGFHGYGLVFDGITIGDIPSIIIDDLHGVNPLHTIIDTAESMVTDRLNGFHDRCTFLPDDLTNAAIQAQDATIIEHLSLERLTYNRSREPLSYLMRSVYAQASLERRLGRPVEHVIDLVKNAYINVADTLVEPLREVIHASR